MSGQQPGLLARLIRELVRLPGIGQKTAQRLAFHLMKTEKDEAIRLADVIREFKERLTFCTQCRNISEESLCEICLNPKRDKAKILVVEEPSTLYAIEQSRGSPDSTTFYLVLFPHSMESAPQTFGPMSWKIG